MKNLFKFGVACFALFSVAACEKSPNDTPKAPDKATELSYKAGKERGELKFKLVSEEAIKEVKIFWNNKANSETVAIDWAAQGGRSVTKEIANLTEGDHTFEIIAYSAAGKESEAATISGKVYGATYQATLKGLSVETATISGDGVNLGLKDVPSEADFVGLEIKYVNLEDKDDEILVAAKDLGDSYKLAGVDISKSLTYRSVFLPEANALDKFYTAEMTIASKDIVLPTIVPVAKPYANYHVEGFDTSVQTEAYAKIENAWDGICRRDINNLEQAYDAATGEIMPGETTKVYFASAQQIPGENTLQPIWNTFDIGEYAKIANIHIYYALAFEGSYPREYELYALDHPTAEPAANWDNWVKIGGGGSEDKGALDRLSATAAKDLYWSGQSNEVAYEDAPVARYYRFKCTKGGTWEFGYAKYNYYMYSISEITFFKYDE